MPGIEACQCADGPPAETQISPRICPDVKRSKRQIHVTILPTGFMDIGNGGLKPANRFKVHRNARDFGFGPDGFTDGLEDDLAECSMCITFSLALYTYNIHIHMNVCMYIYIGLCPHHLERYLYLCFDLRIYFLCTCIHIMINARVCAH